LLLAPPLAKGVPFKVIPNEPFSNSF